MSGPEYRALRLSRGWTQQQLADLLGRHRVTVADRESEDVVDREAELAILRLTERHQEGGQ